MPQEECLSLLTSCLYDYLKKRADLIPPETLEDIYQSAASAKENLILRGHYIDWNKDYARVLDAVVREIGDYAYMREFMPTLAPFMATSGRIDWNAIQSVADWFQFSCKMGCPVSGNRVVVQTTWSDDDWDYEHATIRHGYVFNRANWVSKIGALRAIVRKIRGNEYNDMECRFADDWFSVRVRRTEGEKSTLDGFFWQKPLLVEVIREQLCLRVWGRSTRIMSESEINLLEELVQAPDFRIRQEKSTDALKVQRSRINEKGLGLFRLSYSAPWLKLVPCRWEDIGTEFKLRGPAREEASVRREAESRPFDDDRHSWR